MEMLWRRLALAVGLACGLVGTQAPEFAQQYRQRLAGAVDELTRVVQAFDAEAQGEGLPADAAIGGWRTIPMRSPASAATTWRRTRRGSPT